MNQTQQIPDGWNITNFIVEHWDKIGTLIFAFLSVIFAFLSFLVLYLEYRRNNPKVEVKVNRALANIGGNILDCVSCSILNKGRRPVQIRRFYFLLKDKQTLVFFPTNNDDFLQGYPEFPTTLNEMEIMEFSIYLAAIKSALKDIPSKIEAICFQDTADNVYQYKLKKKHWKDLTTLN